MFQAFALVWQAAQNGRLHKTGGTYYQSCMYPTDSAWPAFLMPFLILLPVSGQLSRGFTVPEQSVPTLRYTRRYLTSAVPWISEDRLLCIMLRDRSVSRVLQKTPEMHEKSRLSGQFDSCLFYYTIFTN